jgi:hypothetical protein
MSIDYSTIIDNNQPIRIRLNDEIRNRIRNRNVAHVNRMRNRVQNRNNININRDNNNNNRIPYSL